MTTTLNDDTNDLSASARAEEGAHDAVDRAAGSAGKAEVRVRQVAEDAGRRAEQVLEEVQAFVKDRPVAALGMAIVAGVLVTRLLRR